MQNLVGEYNASFTSCHRRQLHCDLEQLEQDFPYWKRLHGFWRTLPNFNPYTASSEPGQDLAAKALALVQNRGAADEDTNSLSNPNDDTSPSPAADIGDHTTGDNPDTEELAGNVSLSLLFLMFAHFLFRMMNWGPSVAMSKARPLPSHLSAIAHFKQSVDQRQHKVRLCPNRARLLYPRPNYLLPT